MKKESSDELSSKRPTLMGKSSGRTPNIEHPRSNTEYSTNLKTSQTPTAGPKGKGTRNAKRQRFKIDESAIDLTISETPDRRYVARKYDLEERLLIFAADIVRLADALPNTKAGRHVADQLLRCGTSPLANHGEVQGAESRKDFIHKLGICLKELRESRRWLLLVHRVPLLEPTKVKPLLGETEELIKIFSASIRTAQRNKR